MSDDQARETEVGQTCGFFKSRVRRAGGLRQTRASSDDSGYEESPVKKVERKRINGIVHGSSASKKSKQDADKVVHFFSSSNQEAGPSDQGATATSEINTELNKDARAIFERAQKVNEELNGKKDDKVYRGINNYAQYIPKKDSAAGSAAKMKAKGPRRAPANIRTTERIDHQPAVCKDYKEAGFCSRDNSCMFMHDRSDYKNGRQIDRDWVEKQTKKAHCKDSGDGDQEDNPYEITSDGEHLPSVCPICRGDFKNPSSTKCGHNFCLKCAVAELRKSNRCFVCAKPTGGSFKPAKELREKLKEQEEGPEKTKYAPK